LDLDIQFLEGSITEIDFLDSIIGKTKPEAIINLAGLKSVAESQRIPEEYFRVNHKGVENLLDIAIRYGVSYFVQSSTAAVYGGSKNSIVSESEVVKAISVYGESKLMAEKAVSKFIDERKIRATNLRYFNVIGSSDPVLQERTGDNIVPVVVRAIHENKAPYILGTDYSTKDGTCIRDYIHVVDVALAHIQAINALQSGQVSKAINIGTGVGYSVREIISEITTQMNSSLLPIEMPRREGDPAVIIANSDLAKTEIGFHAKFSLKDMISTSIW
jgi:UDP-glucose 4-epimerase